MLNLIKKFAQGILYVLTFPVFLVLLAIFAVYGLLIMFIEGIRFIYNFFTGRNIHGELEEDVAARKIIEANNPNKVQDEEKEPEIKEDEPTPLEQFRVIEEPEEIVEHELPPVVEEKAIKEEPLEDLSSIAFIDEENKSEEVEEISIFDNFLKEEEKEPIEEKKEEVDTIEEEIIMYKPRGNDEEIIIEDDEEEEEENDSTSGVSFE